MKGKNEEGYRDKAWVVRVMSGNDWCSWRDGSSGVKWAVLFFA